MKALAKHMDLRHLESSPAKDTPEAKAIQELLAKRGINRAAVPVCYNVCWNYHHTLKVSGGNVRHALESVLFDKERLRKNL